MNELEKLERAPGLSRFFRFGLGVIFCAGALLLLGTTLVHAHGKVSHIPGDADFGVIVGRYQFLLEGKERAVNLGDRDRLVLRVYDMKAGRMLQGARLLMAPKLPQAFAELPKNNANPEKDEETPPGSPLSWTADGQIDLSNFRPATETNDPGHYFIDFSPMINGKYLLQVALLQPGSGGRPDVLVTQLPFEVKPLSGTPFRMWFSLGAILLAFAIGAYAFRVKAQRDGKPIGNWRFDLLDLPWFARLMRASAWKVGLQIAFLLVFLAVIVLGFIDTQESSRNLSTILMWTLWWAGVIFTFVLMGRAWCLICPIGAVSEWTNQLTGSTKQFSRRYRNLWMATSLFVLLTWMDGYFGIVGSPARTAFIFLMFTVIAIGVGAIFARRTFCRYICPIGGVIGLYSMFAPVELRAKSIGLCQQDPTKACYVGNEMGKGCPMFEFPQRMDANTYCIYCGDCLNTCFQENIGMRFRPFGKDLWATHQRSFDEAALALVMVALAGMAAGHMIADWHIWMDAIAGYLPFHAFGITHHPTIEKLTYTLVLILSVVGIPLLVYSAGYFSWEMTGKSEDTSAWKLFVRFGYAFIPLGLAMHLAHNLQHFFLEGPLVGPVLLKTLNHFTPWNFGVPNWMPSPWLEPPVLYWLQMLILLVALLYSLYITYRLTVSQWGAGAVLSLKGPWPYLVLILAFALTNAYLLNLPMGARH